MKTDRRDCGHCIVLRGEDGYCRWKGTYQHAWAEESCFMGEEDRDGFHVLPLRPRREMKVCKTCGRLLPLGQFPRHFKSRDGHTEDCHACYSKKMRAAQARRRANRTPKPPVVREELPEGMKRCKRCGRVLPVTEYGPHRNAYDHLFPLCNDCRREVGRESYEKACRKKGIEPKPRKI